MKRIVCAALAFCLTAGMLCGCGKKDDNKQNSSTSSQTPSAVSSAPAVKVTPAPVKKAKAVKVVKASDGLNVRSKPSTEGEIFDLVENGTLLPLLVGTPSDGWYEVEYQGKTAYVSADYVEVQDITLEEYNKLRASGSTTSSGSETSSKPEDEDPGEPTSSKEPSSSEPASSKPAGNNTQDGE